VDELSEKVTFIHAADLHLDSPFLGLAKSPEKVYTNAQESTFIALNHLVNVAIEKDVDFVLLVGDIFDESIQSLKAHVKLRQAFEKLHNRNINVYMSYGNHDYVSGHTHQVTYPDNVFIFPSEQVTTFNYPDDTQPLATIYGFSYEQQHVTTRKVNQFQLQNENIPLHIATLHGSLSGEGGHQTYAPFSLTDLTKKPFDYWALGHIHKRQILHDSPPIVYPGNIQGRHHLESGVKGCYYVELSKTSYDLTFIPLNALQFATIQLDVTSCETVFSLEKLLEQPLAKMKDSPTPLLVKLHLTGNEQLYEWERYDYLTEMINLINERYLLKNNWLYIYDVTTSIEQIDRSLVHNEHFFQALQSEFANESITPLLTQLYEHPQARKYLHRLTEADEKVIKQKAEQLLMNELLRTKR